MSSNLIARSMQTEGRPPGRLLFMGLLVCRRRLATTLQIVPREKRIDGQSRNTGDRGVALPAPDRADDPKNIGPFRVGESMGIGHGAAGRDDILDERHLPSRDILRLDRPAG